MRRNEHIQDPRPSSCKFVKADDARCRARPRRGWAYRLFHDPTIVSERRAARHAGGVERSKKAAVVDANEPDCPLESVGPICEPLGQTINQVRKGKVDPRVGSSETKTLLSADESTALRLRAWEVAHCDPPSCRQALAADNGTRRGSGGVRLDSCVKASR